MAENYKPGLPGVLNTNTAGRLPADVTQTGTIYHDNVSKLVVGTGTLFTSKLKVGMYIFANNVLRRITHIESDTRLLVDSTFGSVLVAGTALKTCESAIYRKVKIKNIHATVAATVLGQSVPAGQDVDFYEQAGLEPLFYDGTGSTLLITTQT